MKNKNNGTLLVDSKPKFDFDDILIVPEVQTTINSRYNDITLDENNLPLLTAPMDTVVDLTNMDEFLDNGITVVLPRTVSLIQFIEKMFTTGYGYYDDKGFSISDKYRDKVFISFGLGDFDDDDYTLQALHKDARILIDVANGHLTKIIDICRDIKKQRPDIIIMVGNIANPETYRVYAESGVVDKIRVGIGAGGGCTTTKNAVVGYPMASLISEIKAIKNDMEQKGHKNLPLIIADGGMKEYGDVIKAMAIGADMVMVGSLFNKAIESCSPNYFGWFKVGPKTAKMLFKRGFKVKKYFRGMSTKAAQKAMGKTVLKTSEGVIRYRFAEYTLAGWLENFKHYLRSSMSYTDCRNLKEYIGGVLYCFISDKAYNRYNK